MEDEDNARGPEPEPDEVTTAFWRLVLPLAYEMPDDGDDACPNCGFWNCQCGQPSGSAVVAASAASTSEPTDSDPDMDEALRRARKQTAVLDVDAAFEAIVAGLTELDVTGASGQCPQCGGTFEGHNGGLCSVCKSVNEKAKK